MRVEPGTYGGRHVGARDRVAVVAEPLADGAEPAPHSTPEVPPALVGPGVARRDQHGGGAGPGLGRPGRRRARGVSP